MAPERAGVEEERPLPLGLLPVSVFRSLAALAGVRAIRPSLASRAESYARRGGSAGHVENRVRVLRPPQLIEGLTRRRITSSTPRRSASSATSSITGRPPWAPLPTTSRRQLHGLSSAAESGVWPYRDRKGWRVPSSAPVRDRRRGRVRRSGHRPRSNRRRTVRTASSDRRESTQSLPLGSGAHAAGITEAKEVLPCGCFGGTPSARPRGV